MGAVSLTLPIGYRTVVHSGVTLYACDGVFYRRAPVGYEVVALPTAPVEPQPPAAGSRVAVTTELLNVRSGPGMNHHVIEQVFLNTVLAVHGQAPGWLYVELPAGSLGWVLARYTAPLMPASG